MTDTTDSGARRPDPVTDAAGKKFLRQLLLTFAGLAAAYTFLHWLLPGHGVPLNESLTQVLREVEGGVERIDASKDGAPTEAALEAGAELASRLAVAQSIFDALQSPPSNARVSDEPEGLVGASTAHLVQALFVQAASAIEARDTAQLEAAVASLDRTLREGRSYFWRGPWLFLEIWCWALAATLIRLSAQAARYLGAADFRPEKIPHHRVLIYTVPVMALVIALVLSFVKVSVSLGNSEVALDLNDPVATVIIAFLIGFAPWKASEYLAKLSDTLFDSMPPGKKKAKAGEATGTAETAEPEEPAEPASREDAPDEETDPGTGPREGADAPPSA